MQQEKMMGTKVWESRREKTEIHWKVRETTSKDRVVQSVTELT